MKTVKRIPCKKLNRYTFQMLHMFFSVPAAKNEKAENKDYMKHKEIQACVQPKNVEKFEKFENCVQPTDC